MHFYARALNKCKKGGNFLARIVCARRPPNIWRERESFVLAPSASLGCLPVYNKNFVPRVPFSYCAPTAIMHTQNRKEVSRHGERHLPKDVWSGRGELEVQQ